MISTQDDMESRSAAADPYAILGVAPPGVSAQPGGSPVLVRDSGSLPVGRSASPEESDRRF